MTKTELYNVIIEAMADNAEVVEMCEKEIASIAKAAEKAKERRAAKAAEEDTILPLVQENLTAEFQPAQAIVDAINDEEITLGKVRNRLAKLVAAGVAQKEQVKGEGKGKITVYALA